MVAVARRFVRDRLIDGDAADQMERAMIVTSELVTNAVMHARTVIGLRVAVHARLVRIEVSDDNPRHPVAATCPPDSTTGRGLALVSAMTTSWGVHDHARGKVVWAELGPGV